MRSVDVASVFHSTVFPAVFLAVSASQRIYFVTGLVVKPLKALVIIAKNLSIAGVTRLVVLTT